MATILLTGATGYIGSHTWLALREAGFDVVGVDNLCNSSVRVLDRLQRLGAGPLVFERLDVADAAAMHALLQRHRIDAVVHFAALKAVGESVDRPLDYYGNNLGALVQTCRAMQAHDVRRIVFSSSATVYGRPQSLPIREDAPLSAASPYGQTKLVGEQILRDLGQSDPAWRTACLRYFNPVGAHDSGLIGEDPRGIPNNLMPYVAQVAVGRREALSVYGDDYDTPDGTGVRDYIHVVDLAEGHVAALRHLLDGGPTLTVNLGTGQGSSVYDVVRAYERASGRAVPCRVVARRAGDVDACWADPTLARTALGWQAQRDLARMCEDSWRWQSRNPEGYDSAG
ncbi:MAG: UDP-glucose 4-epimerase GalE [Rubrivivax sp.]